MDRQGVWVAYYSDRSAAVAFLDEVDALRYAVDHTMSVHFVPDGHDVFRPEDSD